MIAKYIRNENNTTSKIKLTRVNIVIGDRRLDLFKDENIKLTSALNDIEKLSNVFNDFTQSFTVPATANNNEIFHTFNDNIRVDAYLELNTVPFRYGFIELESVKVKSGRPESYKITFFGGVTQLSEVSHNKINNFL